VIQVATSLGETARPEGDKRLVLRYGIRFQDPEGKWAIAKGGDNRQIVFRDFDPALTFAENLVRDKVAQIAEVFTQRLYVLGD
jgi:hypothetical protein